MSLPFDRRKTLDLIGVELLIDVAALWQRDARILDSNGCRPQRRALLSAVAHLAGSPTWKPARRRILTAIEEVEKAAVAVTPGTASTLQQLVDDTDAVLKSYHTLKSELRSQHLAGWFVLGGLILVAGTTTWGVTRDVLSDDLKSAYEELSGAFAALFGALAVVGFGAAAIAHFRELIADATRGVGARAGIFLVAVAYSAVMACLCLRQVHLNIYCRADAPWRDSAVVSDGSTRAQACGTDRWVPGGRELAISAPAFVDITGSAAELAHRFEQADLTLEPRAAVYLEERPQIELFQIPHEVSVWCNALGEEPLAFATINFALERDVIAANAASVDIQIDGRLGRVGNTWLIRQPSTSLSECAPDHPNRRLPLSRQCWPGHDEPLSVQLWVCGTASPEALRQLLGPRDALRLFVRVAGNGREIVLP